MEHHRMTKAYSDAFQTFLDHTDVKPALLMALSAHIKTLKPQSLLDIGPGNGDLSLPLSRQVPHYLAVENNPKFAGWLRNAGLNVLEDRFPCMVPGEFDAVLMCHSLPSYSRGADAWPPFVESAWRCIAPGGHMLIVTFEDEDSEWNTMVNESGLESIKPREERLDLLRKALHGLGAIDEQVITTHVRSTDLAAAAPAAFLFHYIELYSPHVWCISPTLPCRGQTMARFGRPLYCTGSACCGTSHT